MRRRKQKRPRAVIKIIDQIARAADVAAESADCLRQGSNLNVDASVHRKMIDRAASLAAEDAGRVRVVDHHDRAVLLGRFAQAGQRADVAIHREDAVGDQQFLAGLVLHAGELLFGVGHVFVAEDENLRSRKTAAIDDRGVIQLVGNDEIVFAQKCRNRPRVRRESRLEHHAGLDVLEARDLLFQLHVNLHRARDGAHRSRPDAILARGFKRRFAQLRMRSEPKVIVRGKVDDPLAVEGA